MDNFKCLQSVFTNINGAEDRLKSLRDNVETETQRLINAALLETSRVRDALWKIDNAMAKGEGV